MTQEVATLIEVNDYESKCSLCGDRIVANLLTEKGRKRSKARLKRQHENLFRAHVQRVHANAHANVGTAK
jgi:hypothetical protein